MSTAQLRLDEYDGPMPLSRFPEDDRNEIERLAELPVPPPKWLDLAGGVAQIVSRAWLEWHWRRGRLLLSAKKREAIPVLLRAAVLERDGLLCQLCGLGVGADDVHLDHIVPVCRGGQTSLENLQVTHSKCNMRKGARLMEELV